MRERYAEAVAASESDAERARRMFKELAERLPEDTVVRMWRERLAG
jgi:hypothetical protein